jgi:diguanylate cyclase (GGDEF)-like protein
VVCEDITEISQMAKTLEHQARADALTGLPNRIAFDQALDTALDAARRQGSRPAVLFLDLDRFKAMNDTLGHAAGDQLLRAVSQRLRTALRSSDVVSRTGGDEFQILLPSIDGAEVALIVAQAIRAKIETPFRLEGERVRVACNIGISCYPDDGANAPLLTKHADAAMSRAKELGRNNVQFYTPALSAKLRARMDIESALRAGIAREELRLHLQPQFDLCSGQMRCVEALVRWQHPQRGLILPSEFIAVAEDTGLIGPITDWVIRSGLATLTKLRINAPQLRLAVNISPREFLDAERMIERVLRPLEDAGLPAACLELEITESAILQRGKSVQEVLSASRERGVRIAIDDFGTGFSSLSHLLERPIDLLKVEHSFVDGMQSDARKYGIVKGIVSMARSLSLVCIAEGVETEAQLECLRSMDCEAAQGYLLARLSASIEIADLVA